MMKQQSTTNEMLDDMSAAQVIWDYMRLGHSLKKADAIVVPGCYDPDCAAYAAELYHQDLAPVVIVSGGIVPQWADAKWHGMNEADVFAEMLIAGGVPQDAVLRETRATNTSENLWYSAELMAARNLPFERVILTQKPSFERRLYATARHRWPDKEIIVTSRPVVMRDYLGGTVDYYNGLSSLIGDFQRLETYRGLHLADEAITPECWTAFEYLAKQGYTSRLCEPCDVTLQRVANAQVNAA